MISWPQVIDHSTIRDCSHIMATKFMGLWSPLSPIFKEIANCTKGDLCNYEQNRFCAVRPQIFKCQSSAMGCSSAKMILLTYLLGLIELPPPLNWLLAEKVKFLPEQFGTRPNGPKKWRHLILRTRLFLLLDIRKIPISMLKLSTRNLVFWSPGNSYRFPIWLTLFSMLRPGGGFLSGPTLCPLACSAGPPLISPVTTARPPPPSLPRAAPLEPRRVAL